MLISLLLSVTLLTEWGNLDCSEIGCVRDRDRGIRIYWSAPTLIVTKDHRPLIRRVCDRVDKTTWDCRPAAERGEPFASGGSGDRTY